MATKKFLHDIDLASLGQIKHARIHNVTSVDLTTLAGDLGAAHRGLVVYNTTDSTLYTWNGASFNKYSYEVTGDIVFKGIINPTTSSSVVGKSGDQYVVDTAGTLSTQLGAITYTPSANVEVGDVVLFTSATTASILERNLEQATTTTLGTVRISTQAEVDAGSVTDEVVTPATLHGYVNPEFDADRARLTAVEADVATLEADLATEAAARAAADTAEASARAAADAGLAADIATEASARAAADTGLAADIAAEASARASADTAEAAARSAADAGLAADIASEASRAGAAEAGLAADIATEASARAAADTAEASARAAADAALDGRVTALEARDEVFVYTASVDLVADTALTVAHNLGLANKDAFTINTMHNGEQVSVQVTSVGVNSLTLTSAVGLTGLVVSIIGF